MVKETLPVAKVECEKFSLDHVKIGQENKKLDIFVFAKIKDSVPAILKKTIVSIFLSQKFVMKGIKIKHLLKINV